MEKENFRYVFLEYLLNPSNKNKNELSKACVDIYNLAFEQAKEKSKDVGADEGNEEVDTLIKEAVKDICITEGQKSNIINFAQTMPKEKAIFIETVLISTSGTLTEEKRIISDNHYKAFASIYPIELDGLRIKDTEASKAALTLSSDLMKITRDVSIKNKLEEQDIINYTDAYAKVKNHGIEKHRGLKEKFHNFCIAVSCLFIFPIFIYSNQNSFWSTTKTKTQTDVDNSFNSIQEFKKSFMGA